MSFAVKTCTTVSEMHIAPILVAPENGCRDNPRTPSFSWIGFPDTTKYEFILAKDADFAQVIVREEVPGSAYQHSGSLDWGTTCFWQVRALEPVPSERTTGVFTVMQEPKPSVPAAPSIPLWMIWVIIGVLTVLDIAIIALCLLKR